MAYMERNWPEQKILLMALAGSGRTGIAKKFQDETWPHTENAEYDCTIDYERINKVFAGTQFTILNMGGQTVFLDRFIGELAEFMFSKVASLVFCVNAINIPEIQRAKYYFDLVLQRLDTYSPTAKVFLIITKMDLVPEDLEKELVETITTYMLQKVTKQVPIFQTSIFDHTATQAVEAIIRANIPIFDPALTQPQVKRFKTPEEMGIKEHYIQKELQILKEDSSPFLYPTYNPPEKPSVKVEDDVQNDKVKQAAKTAIIKKMTEMLEKRNHTRKKQQTEEKCPNEQPY